MARRTAEGEGRALAFEHGIDRGEGGLRGPVGRFPRPFGDRCRGIETVLPEQGIDPAQLQRPPPDHRESVRIGIAFTPRRTPLLVRGAEEIQIVRGMDPKQRLHALIRRRLGPPDRLQDRFHASGVLRSRMHRAVEEFSGGPVRPLPLVPETSHGCGVYRSGGSREVAASRC